LQNFLPCGLPAEIGQLQVLFIIFAGQEFNLSGRGFSGGGHKLASGFVQAAFAVLPFFHRALALAAIKFTKGAIFRNGLDKLVSEPPPASANQLIASQLFFWHEFEPPPHGSAAGFPTRRFRGIDPSRRSLVSNCAKIAKSTEERM